MNNYKESDYAKNRYSPNIVYQFFDGNVEITVTQYLHENPTRDEQDFWDLKALSDKEFHREAKQENTAAKNNVRFDTIYKSIESDFFCYPSPEEILAAREERNRERKFIEELLSPLTELQRKRLILNIVDGLSHHAIARLEGVSQTAVSLSIAKAKRLIRSRFWD
jgi:DNA-directed RNA polymerase specialized sigma24 family protein